MNDDLVTLQLTKAEAVVLSEWLARVDSIEARSFEDPAEQEVLCRVEAMLERVLVEPIRSD